MHRKTFIAQTGLLLSGLPFESLASITRDTPKEYALKSLEGNKNSETFKDENYWKMVRGMFKFPKDYINLENGYFSPQPISTEQFHQTKEDYINTKTSWFMRREQNDAIEKSRQSLASFLGCETEELVLTRNTTESLNIVIAGFPWKKGDEVIIGNQDYGSMVAAFEQQAKRNGIVIKIAQVPLHPQSDDDLVNAYMSLVSPKTKIIHLTHLINLSGQIIPVKKIIDVAHVKGIEVIVDSAHSIAHVNFKPGELDADYLGASLHKWLCCPLGAGVLIIKKKHVSKIWPLMADSDYAIDNIRKFEHQGTRPIQTLITIAEAIRFHEAIGSELKQNRLRYLKNYWTEKVKNSPKVTINTPLNDDERSCAIANIAIDGYTPQLLSDKLFSDFKIFTVAIDHPYIKGVRVTPHLYTSLADLDKFVEAVVKL